MSRKRIEYLDAIKGFLILWVVVFHLGDSVPLWATPPYRMPLFFAISGIFFKMCDLKIFIKKKVKTLLIPLVVFYVLSTLFCFLKYYFTTLWFPNVEYESIGDFTQYSVAFLNLINISNENVHAPFVVNTALWFLLVLFFVQMLFFQLNRILHSKIQLFLVCCIFNLLGIFLKQNNVTGLFYMCFVFDFLFYYCAGFLFGLKFMTFITNKKFVLLVSLLSLLLLGVSIESVFVYDYFMFKVYFLCFSSLICILFSLLDGTSVNLCLSFLGRNSLIILTTHLLIMSVYRTLFTNVIFPKLSLLAIDYIYLIDSSILIMTLFTSLVISFFFNRYAPFLIGK